jgi:hypothetical protein
MKQYKLLFLSSLLCGTLFICCQSNARIEINNTKVTLGTILEGTTDTLKAIFKIRNIGKTKFVIKNVRSYCSCTIVKYDTTILPEAQGKIEIFLLIAGYSNKLLKKSVILTTNAVNMMEIKLEVDAIIKHIIEIQDGQIILDPHTVLSKNEILLSTKKNFLLIHKVKFCPYYLDKNKKISIRDSIDLQFTFKPTNFLSNDGYWAYKLSLFPPHLNKTIDGRLIIYTNHPAKPEMFLEGRICTWNDSL